MDYDWALLRSFAAVCEEGSISSAARAINGSQPTISRHISQLEQQIGARLFDRDVRGMALTPKGEVIYTHVKAMAEAAAKLALTTGEHGETFSGSVRITASNIVATYVLPEILSRLRQAEPAISVEVVATDNTENLLRREADIAIRMFRPTQGDVIAKKVGELTLGAFAHEDYIARKGMPTSLADFADHDIIGYDRAPQIIEGFRRFGLTVDRDFFAFRSDNQVVCWQLVTAACGIGFNQIQIGDRTPGIVRIDAAGEVGRLPIWLTVHQELRSSARVRRVFDFLVEGLGGDG